MPIKSALVGSIVGVLGTLAGVCLGYWLNKKIWRKGYFLQKKADVLADLYGALDEYHHTLHHYGNNTPATFQKYEDEVDSAVKNYIRAYRKASIYLEDEQEDKMKEAMGTFRGFAMAIWLNLPEEEIPGNPDSYSDDMSVYEWSQLDEDFEEAEECMKNMLMAEELEGLVED